MKGRSLGERPAFLRSPPGCGYRSLGVCGKGASMSGLGGRRRAMSISAVSGAPVWEALQSREKPFRYELQEARTVSNAVNLTNGLTPRHLQNCISGSGGEPDFPRFCCTFVTTDSQKREGSKSKSIGVRDFFPFHYNHLIKTHLYLHGAAQCKFSLGANIPQEN